MIILNVLGIICLVYLGFEFFIRNREIDKGDYFFVWGSALVLMIGSMIKMLQ